MIITENGFEMPSFLELYNKKLNNFKTVKPNLAIKNSNLIISVLKFDATEEYDSLQEGLSCYNNLSVYTAVGKALDDIVGAIIDRNTSKYSYSKLLIHAKEGTEIPPFWGVETADKKQFITLNTTTVIIDSSEELMLDLKSILKGNNYNTEIGTITIQIESITGVISITNPIVAAGGADTESDTDLRMRYLNKLKTTSKFSTEGIKQYIITNTAVSKCLVIENDLDNIDSENRPAHSYEIIAVGDTDENILNAAWSYKLAGIKAYGNIKKTYDDIEVGISRGNIVDLFCNIKLTVDSAFNDSSIIEIKRSLYEYVESIEIHGTVYLYEFVGRIYQNASGIKQLIVVIGSDPNKLEAADFIPSGNKDISRLLEENISIEIK